MSPIDSVSGNHKTQRNPLIDLKHGPECRVVRTAIDRLLGHLLLGASVVLGRLLGMESGSRAVSVQVAAVVHGLLEGVGLPAEDVVAVGGGATWNSLVCIIPLLLAVSVCLNNKRNQRHYSPNIHAVDKRAGAIGGPHGLVGEGRDVPHELVHDLGELDGVSRGAGTAAVSAVSLAVGDVALVVGAVEVLAVPAAKNDGRSVRNLRLRTRCVGRHEDIRREDDGLSDHLARRVCGDVNSVTSSARGSADEVVVVGRGPTTMADVRLVDLVCLGVCGVAGNHTEALDDKILSAKVYLP